MKIALIGSRGIPASYSGFETFYEQLAVRLAERGHSVTVYNRAHHIEFRGKEYKGVRLVRLPSVRSKHLDTLSHTFISLIHSLAGKYDIHYVCIVGNSPLLLIPRMFGKKVIINVDGADFERDKWTGFAKTYLRWTEKIACRLAHVVIADSTVIQRRYQDLYKRDTVFIPYGSNTRPRALLEHNTGILDRYNLETDGYILFVSRMTPENRAHTLIEAYKRANSHLKLVIVGDAPYADEYKKRLESMCDENIIMTGYLFGEDYQQISSHCRFFVLPAGIDGTRPVLLDQMGFGNCVVVRDTPANMEVIGDAGLSFSHDNPVESLANVITELTDNVETVQKKRQQAIQRMESVYSWEKVTDDYIKLFSSLCE